ncbi:MAG: carbohydrate ABC transporter permease [Anaerolineales bacterium]|nr:carbohydrate ABC transporter permease [Anaerolineales bacterium]
MSKLSFRKQILSQLALVLIGAFVLLPIWALLNISFDGALKGAPVELRLFPEEFSLAAYIRVWTDPAQSLNFLGLLRNSLTISLGAALLSVIFGMTAAYAFARFRFPGQRGGLFALLVGTLLPPVALMTPLYILLSQLGIRATLFGLIVVYTSFTMPFVIWNMRSAFQAVAKELEEAAFLDGATLFASFWRITLPLALPSIGVAALIAFIVSYTEFAIGWLFVETSSNVTLAMAVSGLMGTSRAWSNMAALSVLMSIPVVILFILLRRYLISGLLIGALED